MLEDSFLGLVENVDGQNAPMPSRASLVPFFFRAPDINSRPEKPVDLRGDDPGRVIIEAHSPFDGYWNFHGAIRRRVSDWHDVGDEPSWKKPIVGVTEHNRARSAFQSFNSFFLRFPVPQIRIADDETGNRPPGKLPSRDDFTHQRPDPRRSSETSSSSEFHRYASGISLSSIESATAASRSATGTTSR